MGSGPWGIHFGLKRIIPPLGADYTGGRSMCNFTEVVVAWTRNTGLLIRFRDGCVRGFAYFRTVPAWSRSVWSGIIGALLILLII